mgnify:CR=1 FL=1
MRHVLSALVMNQPGVLAHISGMLASRAFNIDSLAVGATENEEFSRITFVVNGDEKVLDKVRKQLEKLVTVVTVQDYVHSEYVERDLMLIKVRAVGAARDEVKRTTDIFRGQIVDVGPNVYTIQLVGTSDKLDSFVAAMVDAEILEVVRSGIAGISRGEKVLSL